MLRHWTTWALLAAIIVTIALAGAVGSAVTERVVIDMLIKIIMVLGLSIFISNSGVLSFGHASFAVIGAYSAAWFTLPLTVKKIFLPKLPAFILAAQVGLPAGAAIGMTFAALSAALIGVAVMRLSGIAASIATLAWLVIVNTILANADWLTKGTSSLIGLPLVVDLKSATTGALIALSVAFSFKYSRYGLMLQASREDEVAAAASGIAVQRLRFVSFVLSATMLALGGVLQGHFLGVLTVGQFYLDFTFLTLAMLVMGGIRSLSGAVIGAVVVSVVSEALRIAASGLSLGWIDVPAVPSVREIGLAFIMLCVLLLRPRGLMGDRELGFVGRDRTNGSAPKADSVETAAGYPKSPSRDEASMLASNT
jgi:branched-chain amino acid transport system permease protein